MATVLWGIWGARNLKVWEQKTVSAEMAMQWSISQVTQWRELQRVKEGRNMSHTQNLQQPIMRWEKPEVGKYKINVDASVIVGLSRFSIGMVLRDDQGRFCSARVICHGGEVSVFEAEVQGVLEAVKWAANLGISEVTVESDSLLTVQAIHAGHRNYLEVGRLIHECKMILVNRPDFYVMHIKKQANKVAHLLARVPCEMYCFIDFVSPPQSVLENLLYDVCCS